MTHHFPSHHTALQRGLYIPLSISLIALILSLSGCSKTKPADVQIKERCHQEVTKRQSLRRLEQKFFKDNKRRDILKFKDLYAGRVEEISSSATTAVYVHTLEFRDERGNPIRLVRPPGSVGASMKRSNLATVKFHCKVVWNLFKGEINHVKVKPYLSDLRSLQ